MVGPLPPSQPWVLFSLVAQSLGLPFLSSMALQGSQARRQGPHQQWDPVTWFLWSPEKTLKILWYDKSHKKPSCSDTLELH